MEDYASLLDPINLEEDDGHGCQFSGDNGAFCDDGKGVNAPNINCDSYERCRESIERWKGWRRRETWKWKKGG